MNQNSTFTNFEYDHDEQLHCVVIDEQPGWGLATFDPIQAAGNVISLLCITNKEEAERVKQDAKRHFEACIRCGIQTA